MREIWDYIVIGAGPAGSVFCAKAAASLRILRLDGSFRGEKPCGGLLAPQAAEAIASLGWTMPTKVLADPQVFAVRTIDLQAEIVQSYPRSYLNMRRPAFDAWLRGMAGSGVTTIRARATGLRQEADGWAVEFRCPDGSVDTARGRAIVGADGAGSLVRRAVAPGRDILRYTAIQQWFPLEGVAPLYACVFHRPTSESCSWLFTKDGQIAFGGAFAPKGARENFEEQKRLLRERYGFPLAQALRTEACAVYRPRRRRDLYMGRAGAYLLGEAAGLISPSSFEGISYALKSGAALADAANAAARRREGEAVQGAREGKPARGGMGNENCAEALGASGSDLVHESVKRNRGATGMGECETPVQRRRTDEAAQVFAAYRRATAGLRREVLRRRAKRPFMYWPWLRRLVMKSGVQALRREK